ncbi:hypothetical protein R6Q57_022918 [Mikania cordata]
MTQTELRDANYLNIKELLDLVCETVVNMNKGKTPEEICKTLNIPIEEEVHMENVWAFELIIACLFLLFIL